MAATLGPITTHILDTSRGQPAADVGVRLERRLEDGAWTMVGMSMTDADGRVFDLLPPLAEGETLPAAVYRLTFATGHYLQSQGAADPFYPEVSVTFRTSPGQTHYHVPLLLNPFGYSTYRGS